LILFLYIVIKERIDEIPIKNDVSNTYVTSNNEIEVSVNSNFKEEVIVIGKLNIPKINVETSILSESSEESLEKSIARLSGPKIVNTQGNLCIAGHNYINSNMFGELYKLGLKDKIYVTDLNNNTLEYSIYNIYITSPNDLTCLNENSSGDKEITLITCTVTGLERLIIKAICLK